MKILLLALLLLLPLTVRAEYLSDLSDNELNSNSIRKLPVDRDSHRENVLAK